MRYLIAKVTSTVHLTLIELTPSLSTDDYIAIYIKIQTAVLFLFWLKKLCKKLLRQRFIDKVLSSYIDSIDVYLILSTHNFSKPPDQSFMCTGVFVTHVLLFIVGELIDKATH